ncbi:hypothetical protein ABT346_29355 [Micromonospora peucetia]|uniref:hypothetical protein n=1 Tax=Micromonospora peucetia TaxID=47871 RepID=UPI00332C7C9D
MTSIVWLGDFVRACMAVDAQNLSRQLQVAGLLNLQSSSGAVAVAPDAAAETDDDPAAQETPAAIETPAKATVTPTGSPRRRPDDTLSRAEQLQSDITPELHWNVDPLPKQRPRTGPPPRPAPLLASRYAATILHLAVRQMVAEGDVDIASTVRRMSEARSMDALPRHRRPTLRFGVEILIDRGPGMQPYARDHEAVVEVVRQLVGPGRVAVRYFEAVPTRGIGSGPARTWRPYTPTPGGIPVLLITDFGIGGFAMDQFRAQAADWQRFFTVAHAAGIDCTALVPYPLARWPRWARSHVHMVQWDRRSRPTAAAPPTRR